MPSRRDRRDAVSLAAAVSNLKIDFIDGLDGDDVVEQSLPPEGVETSIKLSKGVRGSWRSHMNALQTIVSENISTAVIFEDDVDWDIRFREQLQSFATASQILTSKRYDFNSYPYYENENPEDEESVHVDASIHPISPHLYSIPLSTIKLPNSPPTSAYGNPKSWDVLWLGHCGAGFPRPENPRTLTSSNAILTVSNDESVPEGKYLRAHPFGHLDALSSSHPEHTRVFHRASGGALCSVAYAVSQRGARRLLNEFSLTRWEKIWDVTLGEWCAGSDKDGVGANRERRCFAVQPPIFAHHHPQGGQSDIGGVGGGFARERETRYLRFSVRMNLEALVRGDGREGMIDQWPDVEEVMEKEVQEAVD